MAITSPLKEIQTKLIELMTPVLEPMGYEVVSVEIHQQKTKKLRVFIDFLHESSKKIGIEDCVTVSKTLGQLFDESPLVNEVFTDHYEMEVSSPGIERPLKNAKDFERFHEHRARIHTFRPLKEEEMENKEHCSKNPKQKNFIGILKGVRNEKVVLLLNSETPSGKKNKKKAPETFSEDTSCIMIPLTLVSKANLEPELDFGELNQARKGKRK